MKLSPFPLLLAVCSLLVSTAAPAAKTYDIELVLFSQQGATAGSQVWAGEPGTLDWDDSIRLGQGQLLSSGRGRLGAEMYALQKAPGFKPLIHAAWRENVQSRENAKAWYLKSDESIAPGTPLVEGLVKISVGRYLHVELDLLIRRRSEVPGDAVGGFRNYRFTTHRRMRSGELHYIDHPLLGMLIEITPG